jgi:hypothetical protein
VEQCAIKKRWNRQSAKNAKQKTQRKAECRRLFGESRPHRFEEPLVSRAIRAWFWLFAWPLAASTLPTVAVKYFCSRPVGLPVAGLHKFLTIDLSRGKTAILHPASHCPHN